jgi:DNA-binding MarR family transcriptional regulator
MLHRQTDSHDRRSTLIALTDKGADLKTGIEISKEQCESKITRTMDVEDVELIKSGLSRLFASIEDELWKKPTSSVR